MSVRTILKWPDRRLRGSSVDVDFSQDDFNQLAEDLNDTMRVNFGLGIAAPQVGIKKNIVIVDAAELSSFNPDSSVPGSVVFINPAYEVLEKSKVISVESCLSVDGITAEIKRYSEISVEYSDTTGARHTRVVSGRESCILQHEFDHLIGKLFIDRMPELDRRRLTNKLKKQKAAMKNAGRDFQAERKKAIEAKRKKARAERKRKNKAKKR